MLHYDVARQIGAPPERVWAILTDAPGLAAGFGIIRVEGTIAHGQRIKVIPQVNPDRAFPVRVAVFQPARRMVWQGGMPLGLFKGVRTFTLDPAPHGSSFRMREECSGPLAGLIGRGIPDLTASFAVFADQLKRKAEA